MNTYSDTYYNDWQQQQSWLCILKEKILLCTTKSDRKSISMATLKQTRFCFWHRNLPFSCSSVYGSSFMTWVLPCSDAIGQFGFWVSVVSNREILTPIIGLAEIWKKTTVSKHIVWNHKKSIGWGFWLNSWTQNILISVTLNVQMTLTNKINVLVNSFFLSRSLTRSWRTLALCSRLTMPALLLMTSK